MGSVYRGGGGGGAKGGGGCSLRRGPPRPWPPNRSRLLQGLRWGLAALRTGLGLPAFWGALRLSACCMTLQGLVWGSHGLVWRLFAAGHALEPLGCLPGTSLLLYRASHLAGEGERGI